MAQDFAHSFRSEHNRWLAGYCFLTCAVTLILLYAGGFTTTIGAGMVFPDWPLSNGSLNPPGWTTDEAMLAEHSHRLLGMTVGTLCIGMVVFMCLAEPRAWVRRLSYLALGFVIFQGLLGGMRVLFDNLDLAKVHGVTAQVFLCLLVSIAIVTSRWFKEMPTPKEEGGANAWKPLRLAGIGICVLTIVQLVIGAVMRHRGAGLSIPYFPHASPDGSFLPVAWNWATTLHYSHRVVALLIYVSFLAWLFRLLIKPGLTRPLKVLGFTGFVLLHLQILLGAGIIWTGRQPIETTLHVLNGALFLSVTWALTFTLFKPVLLRFEGSRPEKAKATRAASGPLVLNT